MKDFGHRLNRRKGDIVSAGDSYKVRARAELEKTLERFPDAEYHEDNGAVVKKITPVDLYRLLKKGEHATGVQGKFLLYLDDRMTEFNGFRDEVQRLQEDINMICKAAEEENLVEETTAILKEKWLKEGRDEAEVIRVREESHFNRRIKVIGIVIGGLGALTAFITWLGLWPR